MRIDKSLTSEQVEALEALQRELRQREVNRQLAARALARTVAAHKVAVAKAKRAHKRVPPVKLS